MVSCRNLQNTDVAQSLYMSRPFLVEAPGKSQFFDFILTSVLIVSVVLQLSRAPFTVLSWSLLVRAVSRRTSFCLTRFSKSVARRTREDPLGVELRRLQERRTC